MLNEVSGMKPSPPYRKLASYILELIYERQITNLGAAK